MDTHHRKGPSWAAWAALVALLGLALALRWRYIREISLFVDEFVTAWAARNILAHGLPIFPSGDFYPHGLIFTYLEAPFVAGGFDETLARLPGLIVSLAGLPVAFWVGRRLLSDTAGLVAAAAMAVDPECITWGGRARMYGLLQLLALLVIYFFYRGLAEDQPRYRWAAMGLLVVAIFTHAEAAFLLPVLALAALVAWPWRRLFRWSVILPFGLGAAGAGAFYLIAKFGQPGHLETLQETRPYLAIGVQSLLSGPALFAPIFTRLYRLPFTVLALAGLCVLVWQWRRRQPGGQGRSSALIYLYVILAGLGALLFLLAGPTWQNERYFFLALPVLFLIAGEALHRIVLALAARLPVRPRIGTWATTLPAVVRSTCAPGLPTVAAVLTALFVGLTGARQAYVQVWGYDQAFSTLQERWQPEAGDQIATPMTTACWLYLDHCDHFAIQRGYEEFVVARPTDSVLADLWTATPIMTTTTALTELLTRAPRVWFVVDGWRLQTRYEPEFILKVLDQMTLDYDERGVMIFRGEGYSSRPQPAVKRQRQADFNGELALTGLSLSSGQPKPGETLEVTLDWQALDKAGPAYTVFLHLVSPEGDRVTGADEPILRGVYQPDLWPKDRTLPDRHQLALPADLPPGHYRLDLGLYYPGRADSPLAVDGEGGNRIALTYLTVGEAAAPPLPSHPAEIHFGDQIRLTGLDLSSRQEPAIGTTYTLTLYWQTLGPVASDYKAFVHLIGPDGDIASQDDAPPGGLFFPTSAWLPGETVVSSHTLSLRADTAPGEYRLLVGLYQPASGERLPVADASGQSLGDAVQLTAIPVEEEPR
jgi:4-amino-4-deoxy-L-arabinose transferase-like glycosyltransferase